ncbi:MAG: hypothetical protein HQM14_16855 [SAR324 cluster bacterium]|nr:hypothetical protein [SAR324 cluster bacterium]
MMLVKMIKVTIFSLLTGLVMMAFSNNAMSLELSTHYLGRAYDLESNQLAYTEEYKEYSRNGMVEEATVTYFSPLGKVIAEKKITFRDTITVPDFMMLDQRNGYIEGVSQEETGFKITFQNDKESPKISKTVQPSFPVVVDAGFHYFILENWEALTAGKRLTFNFVVPSIQDFLLFEIKKVENASQGVSEQVQFQTGVSNFLLKAFVDPILLTYDAKTLQLLKYEGISNVNNDDGKSHNVRIEMVYQDNLVSLEEPHSLP